MIALAEVGKQPLEALLKVAAIFRAGQQRAQIQGIHHCFLKRFRHFTVDNHLGEAFGYGCLANTGFADQERVIFAPSRENLGDTLHLGQTPDQWIDIAGLGLGVEVGRVGIKRPLLCALLFFL